MRVRARQSNQRSKRLHLRWAVKNLSGNKNVVLTTTTDTLGKFSIDVPYDSQYVLRVVQKDLGNALVSFDIPKNNLDYLNHEIVIIK